MSEPILPREVVAEAANAAALRYAAEGGEEPSNPYPVGSDAASAWRAAFLRYLLLHTSSVDAEASA